MESRLTRLEAVQSMLLAIGQMTTTGGDITEFVRAVHRELGRIMYAANFYVALADSEDGTVRFPYFVDELDETPDPAVPVRLASPDESPTNWVIHNRKRLVMTRDEQSAGGADGAEWGIGSIAEHWMGCPLLDQHGRALGAIVIQSYDTRHTFSDEDQQLFAVIARHVATALQGLQSMDRLERAVAERTALLEQQNAALKEAQSELVRQEKLASLGRLVAGVAHEINTPLGICVTATSHLVQELKLTREELANGEMTEDSLVQFFDILDQSLRIMTTNTQRAAALVRSFKQVAVDQSSDDLRRFNLKRYLDEVLLSLQPKFKGRSVKVELDCPADIELESFPGAVSQIVTNMIVNSLLHAYERDQPGTITIIARAEADDSVAFDYRDDGAGMDEATLAQLFDPFFTTKRGTGGSGLGAHILYNLATGALGGTVRVDSAPGAGLHYQLRFPRNRRSAATA
ncbi:ATP-binding protein [Pseudoduganella sp. GCM10020061]|uniref:ATP-binding protein n=1 Tax=Pseudoduganella sp. GCM10020061 TaxID=3317345 RepID=UPI0036266BBB